MIRNGCAQLMKGFVFVAAAGHETTFPVFYVCQSAKPIKLDFVKPVSMIEWFRPAREAHWLEKRHLAHARIVTENGGPPPAVREK